MTKLLICLTTNQVKLLCAYLVWLLFLGYPFFDHLVEKRILITITSPSYFLSAAFLNLSI